MPGPAATAVGYEAIKKYEVKVPVTEDVAVVVSTETSTATDLPSSTPSIANSTTITKSAQSSAESTYKDIKNTAQGSSLWNDPVEKFRIALKIPLKRPDNTGKKEEKKKGAVPPSIEPFLQIQQTNPVDSLNRAAGDTSVLGGIKVNFDFL